MTGACGGEPDSPPRSPPRSQPALARGTAQPWRAALSVPCTAPMILLTRADVLPCDG